jgi:U-box domain
LAGKSQRKPAQPESSEDLECPISHLLMVNDPVMAADGVVYERAAIDAWYARCLEDSGDVRSPMSNEILSTLALTPVNNVRNLAREYAERHRHS